MHTLVEPDFAAPVVENASMAPNEAKEFQVTNHSPAKNAHDSLYSVGGMTDDLKQTIDEHLRLEQEIRYYEGQSSKGAPKNKFSAQLKHEEQALRHLKDDIRDLKLKNTRYGDVIPSESKEEKIFLQAEAVERRRKEIECAVSEELASLNATYSAQQRNLRAINVTHDLQLQLLDTSILSVAGNINALLTCLQNDKDAFDNRSLQLETEVKQLHGRIHEAEAWLEDVLFDKNFLSESREKHAPVMSATESNQRLAALREQRDVLLNTNNELIDQVQTRVYDTKSRLEAFLGLPLDSVTTRMAQHSHFFEAGIRKLQVKWAEADEEESRDKRRMKKLASEFQQLKSALKVQEAQHREIMTRLENEIAVQQDQINARRNQSRAQRDEALRQARQEIYQEVESEWKARLSKAKEDAHLKINEEEAKCKRKYDAIYKAVSKRYSDEYNLVVAKLELQKRQHTQRQNTAASELALLKQREERAQTTIKKLQEKALAKKEEESLKSNEYNKMRDRVDRLWEKFDTPMHERIAFLLRVDELLPYSAEAAAMYEAEIAKLKL
jgi:hypothetical protein